MKLYKTFSLCAMILFAAAGLQILFFPDSVLSSFNRLSAAWGFPQAPLDATNFYLILASSYMYLVSLLSFMMFRHPHQRIYPVLLVHGKAASSLISLYLFLTHEPFLLYLANCILDGGIALAVCLLMRRMKKTDILLSQQRNPWK